MEERLRQVEADVAEVKSVVAVVNDRQTRMHRDFQHLVEALNENTAQITTLNNFVSNRKGFAAGAVTVITLFGGTVGAFVWAILEWLGK
jgi:ABC-type transporter Mla subunit MlaD